MSPNEYFDEVYVLNLERRLDKWTSISSRLKREKITATRFLGVDGANLGIKGEFDYIKQKNQPSKIKTVGAYAILKSFISLYNMILNNRKLKRVLIFEDDVLFHHNFSTLFLSSISSIPNWNMWYLGGSQYSVNDSDKINDNFSYAKNIDGNYSIAVQSSFIPAILSELNKLILPADSAIKDNLQINKNNNIIVSTPFLCSHDYGYSDNWNFNFTEDYVKESWKTRIVNKNIYH